MAELRIPPPKAREVAGKCKATANKLAQIQADLQSSLNQLRGRWRGAAETAYADGFAKRVKRLEERVRLLNDIAAALIQIAMAGEKADADAAGVAPH